MTEYRLKSTRILKFALGLFASGTLVFAAWRGRESALVFLATAGISALSLWVLARSIDILSDRHPSRLKGIGFVVRFLLYGFALSAILKVYPGHSLELFFGIFLSVMAIGLEALFESHNNART